MNISDEFKQDIEILIDSLFSGFDKQDTSTTKEFIEGIVEDESLTTIESMVLLSRHKPLTILAGVMIILGERRNLPMKQFGVYFRRRLRERMQTYVLAQAHEAGEKNK